MHLKILAEKVSGETLNQTARRIVIIKILQKYDILKSFYLTSSLK